MQRRRGERVPMLCPSGTPPSPDGLPDTQFVLTPQNVLQTKAAIVIVWLTGRGKLQSQGDILLLGAWARARLLGAPRTPGSRAMWNEGPCGQCCPCRSPRLLFWGDPPQPACRLGPARSLPGEVASRKTRPAGATLGPLGLRPLHPLCQGLPPSGSWPERVRPVTCAGGSWAPVGASQEADPGLLGGAEAAAACPGGPISAEDPVPIGPGPVRRAQVSPVCHITQGRGPVTGPRAG